MFTIRIHHGGSFRRPPPQVRATIEDITKPGISVTFEHRFDKLLLSTWHDSSTSAKEYVCDSLTPRSLPQDDYSTPVKDSICESVTLRCMPHGMLTPPTDESIIRATQLSGVQGVDTQDHVIEDVIRKLSSEETELDGEAGFCDIASSGIDNSRLSHDESFVVDDLNLNLNVIVDLNVFQTETQTELHVAEVLVFEEVDVGRTKEHIVEQVIVEDVVDDSYEKDAKHGNGQEAIEARSDEQVNYDVVGIDSAYETQYHVESSEDAGEEVDVVNLDGFDSDTGNDNETSNYIGRRLDGLGREMKGVMNASGQ
nr:hypothetical protein [Tanacetum cinerariifolium]